MSRGQRVVSDLSQDADVRSRTWTDVGGRCRVLVGPRCARAGLLTATPGAAVRVPVPVTRGETCRRCAGLLAGCVVARSRPTHSIRVLPAEAVRRPEFGADEA